VRRCLALFHRSTGIATSGGVATVFFDAADFAALLFKVLSVPSVLALDALSLIASALLLRALHTALTGARGATAPASTWRDLLVGLRFVWRHPTIRPMTLMNTAFSASGGAVVGQFAPIASALLGPAQETSSSASRERRSRC